MTAQAYTHTPKLKRNLLASSLQILAWLFFHPTAWNSYTGRIGGFEPDFCLANLRKQDWQSPELRLLLWRLVVIYPLLTTVLILLVLLLLGQTRLNLLALNLMIGWVISITTGLIIGTSVSVGGGIAGGLFSGFFGGILGGILGGEPGGAIFFTEFGVTTPLALDWARSVGVGLTAGLGASVLPAISPEIAAQKPVSVSRQVGSVIVGVLVSVVVVSASTGLALWFGWHDAVNITLGSTNYTLANSIAASRTFGLAMSIAWGLAVWWRTGNWRRGLLLAAVYTLVITSAFLIMGTRMPGLLGSMGLGIASGLAFNVLFITPFVLAQRLAGPWAGVMAGVFGSSGIYVAALVTMRDHPILPVLPLTVGFMLVGVSVNGWRPFLIYPLQLAWNTLLFYAEKNRGGRGRGLLRWNAAFWDERQSLRLYGLEDHLLLTAETQPDDAARALHFLANSPQSWAIEPVRVAQMARKLAGCTAIADIAAMQQQISPTLLEGAAGSLLRSFQRHSQDIAAALSQTTLYYRRLALANVERRLNRLVRELAQSPQEYASHFAAAAVRWHQLIDQHLQELASSPDLQQEIDNPYIFGVPLTEQQEIFVGRGDISARIEQLLTDQRRPPLLLYGQRRMGKTSLLHNLGRLLSQDIVPLYVDGQRVAGAVDYADFLYNLAQQMMRGASQQRQVQFPPLTRDRLAASPFTGFHEWLDAVEDSLAQGGQRLALLAIDEFEALDMVMAKGRFDETDLFNMLRHLIQHRSRFKVLLAGSHALDELQHWASHLINVQVVKIGYLRPEEARQLIEQPVPHFALRYEPEAAARVLALTRGHPHLVQLLCYEIVALKNEQEGKKRWLATVADVETAVSPALEHGSFFFVDIERNQVDEKGAALLRALAAQGENATLSAEALASLLPENVAPILQQLRRRELIELRDEGYRFQVELIRRWFAR